MVRTLQHAVCCHQYTLLGRSAFCMLFPMHLPLPVRFCRAPYPAHMNVVGNNAIWMYGSANSWARNIHIVNAE